MSPEQAKGKPVDRRADIWAFGVVRCETLTERPTYSRETVAETLGLHHQGHTGTVGHARDDENDPCRRLQAIREARFVLEEPWEDVATAPVTSRRIGN